MKELSLHILDLVQNSIQANASEIIITIEENSLKDSYLISVKDNGSGMDKETKEQILDPFFTTKNKKTGLGIPLLKQHAELTGGSISIVSSPGKGTIVESIFGLAHFDRQPMGEITSTLTGLIRSYPEIEFDYIHKVDQNEFTFSTREIKNELEGIAISSKEVIDFIKEMIQDNLRAINAK